MGFDASLLKSVLEQFVDEIGEESVDLIEDRPRFAHAVVVVTDDATGELCQASCIRQLDDVILHETSVANVTSEWMDEEIQRALRELTESRGLLDTPRNSVFVEEKHENQKTVTTTTTSTETNRSSSSRVEFPSMNRRTRSSSAARRFH
ncbi:hypothetical protein GCK72_018883 [Caenorhabditis remanei]|nr:hypothetical protein GCK72_018883 [Caenorhabditis remanei]KAF1752329.1 hypothetical protein GCK72_018883 [Caenorhabditis remanei]